jgi:hypothetical protein
MKKRSARTIEVNLEELDRIIDHVMRAPLSESDGQKIKTALHTMASRLKTQEEYRENQHCSEEARSEACRADRQ